MVNVLVIQSCPSLCDPMNHSAAGSSLWNSSGKNTGVSCRSLFLGIEHGCPALQADSLLSKPTGKPLDMVMIPYNKFIIIIIFHIMLALAIFLLTTFPFYLSFQILKCVDL